jgi:aminopeptidase N
MKIKLSLSFVFLIGLIALVPGVFGQTSKPDFNRSRTYDVQHYVVRLSFDRAAKKISGDTIVRLKPLRKDFKTLELDAAQMTFASVKLESSGADLQYRQADEKIIITLDKGYSPKDLISVRLKYAAWPTRGIYFIDEKIDGGKVFHSAQIWTQNEPERAHFWFPSYDFPDDKATSEEIITVAGDETVIGNGELLETLDNVDGTKTFHYQMSVPHATYVTSFVVGKYAKTSDSYKKTPLGFYVYPGSESVVPNAFRKTKDALRTFEELTGVDFPFYKYDQTIVAGFEEFSAMENVTATTFSDRDVFLAQFEQTRPVVDDIVTHELAHSWFGNMVTCRNWAELWLNEGFATYMEAAFREKMYGRENYLKKLRNDLLEFFAEGAPRAKRHGLYNLLARPDDSIFDVTTYQKGGLVIHMLRETVGDKAFWKAINVYLKRHQFENVETADLQKAMEEATGKKLDWFFAQWVYGAGYPRLEIEPVFYPKTKILSVTVKQTQEAENAGPEVFILPLEIEIVTENGAKSEKMTIDRKEQSFSFQLDGEPKSFDLDKNFKIPLKKVKLKPLGMSDQEKP